MLSAECHPLPPAPRVDRRRVGPAGSAQAPGWLAEGHAGDSPEKRAPHPGGVGYRGIPGIPQIPIEPCANVLSRACPANGAYGKDPLLEGSPKKENKIALLQL